MLIGFSTGCLYKTHDRLAKSTFDIFRSLGSNAIELNCPEEHDLIRLVNEIRPQDLKDFNYVSIHAPQITGANALELLQQAHDKFNFNRIVIHPDEVINWVMFERFSNLPIAIENMDWQKPIGKYTESMQDIFSKIDVPMVLDLNHCYTNDPSMHLAAEMAEKFKEKIVEIHLSGFERIHEPLFQTQQIEILNAVPNKSLPIIIESGCESVEDAKKEFEYIKSYFQEQKTVRRRLIV